MTFQDCLEQRKLSLAVIGLGYVGLPVACSFAEAGFSVIGIDLDESKVTQLKEGCSYVQDVPSERIQGFLSKGNFAVSNDYLPLRFADVAIICVPTPFSRKKQPDLSYISEAAYSIGENLCHRKADFPALVILESTTYPGTTEEIVQPALESKGLRLGKDFWLAYSPERIDPGNTRYQFYNTPKVVGGVDQPSLEAACALYSTVLEEVVPVSSTRVAEMTKLYENIFRHVNIALANEMAIICYELGIDIWEVIRAASTKPFGFMAFKPGPGVGGHCIPIDPYYLSWKLRERDLPARFIELAGEINDRMPWWIVHRVGDALNERQKCLRGANILILGVTYKPDIADIRESPALRVIDHFMKRGALVLYHDPYIPELQVNSCCLRSVDLSPEVIRSADCVVILVHHSNLPYQEILEQAQLVMDTRNVYNLICHPNLIRL